MSRRHLTGLGAAALIALTGFTAGSPAQAVPNPDGPSHRYVRACATEAGYAACHALVRTDTNGGAPATAPNGLRPVDLQSAYRLPSSTGGVGQTIAIVDAYDDPTAESDLAVYRNTFGLSPCTTANGCFRKVNQSGKAKPLPRKDGGWAQEISLDLDMASAVCPNCRLLLVEATTPSYLNLGTAVNTAAALGANAISNSYGGSDASDTTYGGYFNHPGVAVTASSGDGGYAVEFPASSRFVTAVGGTSLSRDGSARGWDETAWSGAGSGCSAYNAALPGQAGADTGCARRAVADVSAVADPYTGVAVYDSTAYQGLSGWLVFGGTSVSAPIVAGVYALAGNAASITNSYPYAHSSALFDVTVGSNGACSTTQWCHARPGWDGPTGLGTPNGIGAF